MEMKVKIPFQQLLRAVRTLTPAEKSKLRDELKEDMVEKDDKSSFVEMLIDGPVFSKEEIKVIESNRKSIAAWRTKG
ncbi:hypothetical protein [Imperialibacter roseus]|uniref:Uncharacterized protein n=2 Tax=Imperialibacter TaxID=1649461 RepID=A0ABZ0IQ35_9BACT|nr:hypothetical protein [Imperialibacter roseus]WOK07157.1 hypothetical protein RT717_00795 [Imperialibacter roseus]CAD5282442.1 conserved hypothetical protein [Imperialibacter sp. 89]CAD5287201.1 conserved hypothetical protein [Imperialibacter sp. 75]VVT30487.1 conserved hypothetical protein [Imperialibacter sp. EC-SDR9]|tara:strand:+ start:290 stop:520 length:231 start_codon:yes stop_codon:yes gene_type:complete